MSLRTNALFLAAITLGSLCFGQTLRDELNASEATDRVFADRLELVSSERSDRPTDCAKAFAKFGSVGDCARIQFKRHKPFFVGYSTPVGFRVPFSYGLAGTAAGDVFSVTYEERGFPPLVLNQHMRLMDRNHTRVVECIKPIRLDAPKQGWVTCVSPVNQEASASAAKQGPIDTTVCDVLADPAAFNNKLVRIRAYYWGGREGSVLVDHRCEGSVWLEYPDGRASPPDAANIFGLNLLGSEDAEGKRILPIPVSLVRDSKFDRFESLLRLNPEPTVPLDGDPVQHVIATFIGRIDGVSPQIHQFFKNQPACILGFGHLGQYEAQFILQSVVDEATVE
jgi:hypothetical protein